VTGNGMRKHSASCDAIIFPARFYFLLRIRMRLAPADYFSGHEISVPSNLCG
jgi:hypothetical protein